MYSLKNKCDLLTKSIVSTQIQPAAQFNRIWGLDYIFTPSSTPPTPPTTTNYLLLLLTAPASQALRLYNYTLTASQAGKLY